MLRRTWALKSPNAESIPNYTTVLLRRLSSPAATHDDEDHKEARAWLSRFNAHTIPKNICEVTFSRSSGPGGQNVNKYEASRSSQHSRRASTILTRASQS